MRDFNAECEHRPGVTVGEDLADQVTALGADVLTCTILLRRAKPLLDYYPGLRADIERTLVRLDAKLEGS